MLQQTEGRVPAAAVLGCTHYPLVAHLFRAALPASVLLLDQPEVVADSLADYLARHRHFAADVGEADRRRFLTSGDPLRVSAYASRFFGARSASRAPNRRPSRAASEGRSRRRRPAPRSEEHTSELQSLMRTPAAVFCLKKKKPR